MSVSKAKERRFCGESKKICLKKKNLSQTTYHHLSWSWMLQKTPCVVTQLLQKNQKKQTGSGLKKKKSHLRRLPAPLPVLGIMGEPPHVPVGLDDLRPQDVILLVLPDGHRLQAAVELEGLRAQLQHCRTRRAKTRNEWVNWRKKTESRGRLSWFSEEPETWKVGKTIQKNCDHNIDVHKTQIHPH